MINRHRKIIELLNSSEKPINGSRLGEIFNVTRQVIVKDIAIIRASGENIVSTNRGYIIPRQSNLLIKQIVCRHHSYEEMERELSTIIAHGGKVKDIIVDHPIYGEISTRLELASPSDVEEFIETTRAREGRPLSELTDGIHIHTIEVENEPMFEAIVADLKSLGYLTD